MISEHFFDELLVHGTSVLEPKRHNFVAKDTSLRDEGGLLLVIWVHECLVIA